MKMLIKPQVPAGGQGSKGFGRHYLVNVIDVQNPQEYKTRKSPHKLVKSYGVVRYDGSCPTPKSRLGEILAEIRREFPEIELPYGY